MPFEKIDVSKIIQEKLNSDPELKNMWDSSRTEYKFISELVKLRKEKGLSQADLAEMTGNKQQVISRIENKENSPTLKTICNILDIMDYDIQLIPKQH